MKTSVTLYGQIWIQIKHKHRLNNSPNCKDDEGRTPGCQQEISEVDPGDDDPSAEDSILSANDMSNPDNDPTMTPTL